MNKSQIPNIISISRLIAVPVIFYAILNDLFPISLIFLIIAAITDVLDGFIARKIESTSNIGSYLDASIDFTLIFSSFTAFVIKGWYDPIILLLIALMFILFIGTSGIKKPVYDPIGKYLGAFLMGMIFLSILIQESIIRWVLLIILAIFCVISIISRILYLYKITGIKINSD